MKNPEIRFINDNIDWQHKQLKNIGTFKSNGVDKLIRPNEQIVNLFNFMDVYTHRKITNVNINSLMQVSAQNRQIKENNLLKGDVLFTPSSETADDIGHSTAIFEDLNNTVYSYHLMRFRPFQNNLDVLFSHYVFNTNSILKQFELYAQGATRFVLNKSSFEKTILSLPESIKIQHKIGITIDDINQKINNQESLVQKLKDIKSALLIKMFPQENQSIPELRFKNFTDTWEQREFKEIFSGLKNNTFSRADLTDIGTVQDVHYGDILINFGELLNVKKEILPYIRNNKNMNQFKGSYLQNGDIIISDTAEDCTAGKSTEIIGIENHKIIAGLHTIPVRPKNHFAQGFLGYFINSPMYHNSLLPLMQGTKVISISKSALQETNVYFPINLQEQEQIGKFFATFDNLITLHQRKCEKLKDLKKALLDKLLV